MARRNECIKVKDEFWKRKTFVFFSRSFISSECVRYEIIIAFRDVDDNGDDDGVLWVEFFGFNSPNHLNRMYKKFLFISWARILFYFSTFNNNTQAYMYPWNFNWTAHLDAFVASWCFSVSCTCTHQIRDVRERSHERKKKKYM